MSAYLLLEDGTRFDGDWAGAPPGASAGLGPARSDDIRHVRNALQIGDRRTAELQHQAIHDHERPLAVPGRGAATGG